MQARAAAGDVVDELLFHPRLPEFLNVFENAGYRFFPREAGEVERDSIGVVNALQAAILSLF